MEKRSLAKERPVDSATAAKGFYLTTAIDYPNAPPHIGHSLEKVCADVVVRFHRLRGDDTAFCMGNDENSQHVVRAAEEQGISPEAWTDQMDEAFRRAWDALEISRTDWVRTTEPRHARASQELFRRAQANGDVYKAVYAGWYCPNDNTFYTDDELVDGRCPLHPTIVPDWLEEENYFFALSRYGDRLLRHIEEHPDFIIPTGRQAEVLALIRQGLRDFSISRPVRPGAPRWGIPVPGDPDHVLYVWFDALTTYLTAAGFPDDERRLARFWPADVHVIGKDITRFHCLYWPAMLLSSGVALPRQVAVHGFLTLEGKRISKTTGNTIDPVDLVAEFGADPVRYYLTRDVSFASDGDFSRTNLLRRYNDDLGNDLGNLLNRVVAMISRYRGGAIPVPGQPSQLEADLQRTAEDAQLAAAAALDRWAIDEALRQIWEFVRRANRYIEETKPWVLAKRGDGAALDRTLAAAAESVRLIALLLAPYIPGTADRIMTQLGLSQIEPGDLARFGAWGSRPLTRVEPGPTLFPRREETPSKASMVEAVVGGRGGA
jgi:methionyl-tRNA synthetase